MKNEKAIEYLNSMKWYWQKEVGQSIFADVYPLVEALNLAIEALSSSEPKTADSGSVDSEMPEVKTDRTTSGDLISRSDAIDAIHCNITVTGRQNAELVAATIGVFADRIKALPSAAPQQPSGDCVSRRAVIELVADYDLSMGQVVKGIYALPSAQTEIIRCKDCIYSSVLLDEHANECGYACNITYDAGGFWLEVEKDHFCGYGERGEADDERTDD